MKNKVKEYIISFLLNQIQMFYIEMEQDDEGNLTDYGRGFRDCRMHLVKIIKADLKLAKYL